MKETTFEEINISDISDGVYIGEYDVNFIYAKVEVTVQNGEITNINILEHRHERGKTAEVIADSIVDEQKIDVDAISGNSFLLALPAHTILPIGFIPAVLKNSSILRIAPLLCPNIHEKGNGVLQEVKSIYFLPFKRGLGKVLVSSITVPNNRSNKFLTGAGTFVQ